MFRSRGSQVAFQAEHHMSRHFHKSVVGGHFLPCKPAVKIKSQFSIPSLQPIGMIICAEMGKAIRQARWSLNLKCRERTAMWR